MDAVVVFDDVFVPWENVFLYRDIEHCNLAYARTGAVVHMAHQVVVKNIAKSEFMLGLAALLVDSIGIEGFQHVQEKLAEIWVSLETMRAFLRAIERYYQAARAEAFDRIPLFRLAWDASLSAFGSRQVLYECFFFGDPVRMAGALVAGHGRQIRELVEKVRSFVQRAKDDAFSSGD
ncbi:MAG TPA: 4-hydroxyphenylacetate 3-hydroxylase C-terminal domain-containing protein [Gammaproteobacteria bacterium]